MCFESVDKGRKIIICKEVVWGKDDRICFIAWFFG